MSKERQLLERAMSALNGLEDTEEVFDDIKKYLVELSNTPLKETYQYYDENDTFIGEKERPYLRVMRNQGCPSYPIDDGNGVYFDDGKKGLCVLSSRVAVWTLRHYAHKYFEETK